MLLLLCRRVEKRGGGRFVKRMVGIVIITLINAPHHKQLRNGHLTGKKDKFLRLFWPTHCKSKVIIGDLLFENRLTAGSSSSRCPLPFVRSLYRFRRGFPRPHAWIHRSRRINQWLLHPPNDTRLMEYVNEILPLPELPMYPQSEFAIYACGPCQCRTFCTFGFKRLLSESGSAPAIFWQCCAPT